RDVRFPRERRITQTRICTALQAQLERQRRGSGARGRERNGHFDRAAINLLSTEELVLVIFSARPLRLAELHARERRGDVHLVLIEVVAALDRPRHEELLALGAHRILVRFLGRQEIVCCMSVRIGQQRTEQRERAAHSGPQSPASSPQPSRALFAHSFASFAAPSRAHLRYPSFPPTTGNAISSGTSYG